MIMILLNNKIYINFMAKLEKILKSKSINFSLNTKTAKVLFNQERDIMRFFMNKINEIKKEF